jgi:hypothetical protein
MTETIWLITAAAVVIVLIVAALAPRKRNRQRLKTRFGPEYSRALGVTGDRLQAEAELRDREKRVEGFELKPLEPEDRTKFENAWRSVQTLFAHDPGSAVAGADRLLAGVMSLRGYPMADFEQRSADISVDHPVHNYRRAHEIAERHAEGTAGTEELRHAMVLYRTLFVELVEEGQPETMTSDVQEPLAVQVK